MWTRLERGHGEKNLEVSTKFSRAGLQTWPLYTDLTHILPVSGRESGADGAQGRKRLLCEVTGYFWPRAERREHEEGREWSLIPRQLVVGSLISSKGALAILPGCVRRKAEQVSALKGQEASGATSGEYL